MAEVEEAEADFAVVVVVDLQETAAVVAGLEAGVEAVVRVTEGAGTSGAAEEAASEVVLPGAVAVPEPQRESIVL